jgi:hypothetical protein
VFVVPLGVITVQPELTPASPDCTATVVWLVNVAEGVRKTGIGNLPE